MHSFKTKKEPDLLFTQVTPFVVLHIALSPETLAASLGADEGALHLMNSYVDFKVVLPAEYLQTTSKLALERLVAQMYVHMAV